MALDGSTSTTHVFTTAGRWKNATKKLTKEQTNKTMNHNPEKNLSERLAPFAAICLLLTIIWALFV